MVIVNTIKASLAKHRQTRQKQIWNSYKSCNINYSKELVKRNILIICMTFK